MCTLRTQYVVRLVLLFYIVVIKHCIDMYFGVYSACEIPQFADIQCS